MTERSHRELQELLGAYALDAVDVDEADAVERHLRECPRCREEVAAHRETAAFMAASGADAPDGVWDRITADLDEAPPRLELAPVVPMRRAPARRWPLAAASAAAAAVVLVLAVVVVRQSQRLDNLGRRQALDQALAAAVSNPDARQVRLQPMTGDGVTAQAVLLPDGTGYVVARGLPPLDPARTYQLWAIAGDQKISLGVLGNRPDIAAFQAKMRVDALAVTAERDGGSVAPTTPPVVVGQVRTA